MVIDGRLLAVEPQRHYDLAQARLVATLAAMELGLAPVSVRLRKGQTRSHYASGEIALAQWGLVRTVLCHELAHHAVHCTTPGEPAHGSAFQGWMVRLLAHEGAPRQAEALAWFFDQLSSD